MRVFPISNWTELDIWQYIAREKLALPPIYYTHKREVVERNGLLVPVTPLTPKREGEVAQIRDVRFRTVGDISCTCPVPSTAATPEDIIAETAAATISERSATRMDDRVSEAAMEERKNKAISKPFFQTAHIFQTRTTRQSHLPLPCCLLYYSCKYHLTTKSLINHPDKAANNKT